MSNPDPAAPSESRARVNEQEFRPIVLHRQVVFEGLGETRPGEVTGYVRVANRGFEKRVFVRYTRDNWGTSMEVEARWAETVDERTDQFVFVIPFPTDWSGALKFAIRYEVRGVEYWDNNEGENYSVPVEN